VEPDSYADDVRHATMFLEGKSEEMIVELVERMTAAANNLDYETAARYRDQISSLRRIQARQYISGARGDVDIVAVAKREGVAVVEVFFVRDGQSLGNKSYFPRNTRGVEAAEILEAFMAQYYLAGPSDRVIPASIIVSEGLAEPHLLVEVLAQRSGRQVQLSHRVRGERARWLDMARRNADMVLGQLLADRANMFDRVSALQELFELDEPPQRIECFVISHTLGEATGASCGGFE